MQNAGVSGPWRLLLRFQRKARQCVAGSGYLQVAPQKATPEPVRVNFKLKWKLQVVGGARNMESAEESSRQRVNSAKERGLVYYKWQNHRSRTSQTHITTQHTQDTGQHFRI
jgi:hypothetical protein